MVGMSHFALHNNPDIFERPGRFEPERWLGLEGKQLNHWLLSFSKGRTDCIGKKSVLESSFIVLKVKRVVALSRHLSNVVCVHLVLRMPRCTSYLPTYSHASIRN